MPQSHGRQKDGHERRQPQGNARFARQAEFSHELNA